LRTPRPLTVIALTIAALTAAGSAQAATAAHTDASARTAAAPQPRAAAVVPAFSDGSFETPAVPAGTFSRLFAGQSVGPWSVTSGSVDLIGPGFWAAAEGDQSLDLDGASDGTISQTFATTPGTTYTVSYALAGNTAAGPTIKTGMALINGQVVQNFSFDITGKTFVDMGYVNQEFTFLATGPSTTLTFASTTTPGGWGPVLDNIQIKATCCKQSCS
jgi:choice-of-anchor C domain-containing protein